MQIIMASQKFFKISRRLTRRVGLLLVLLFFVAVGFSILSCPPWSCSGQGFAAYSFAYMAFFTVLPIGIILISFSKKNRKELSQLFFNTGLLFIIAFFMFSGLVISKCDLGAWKCIELALSLNFYYFNTIIMLPIGIALIFLSRKNENTSSPDK